MQEGASGGVGVAVVQRSFCCECEWKRVLAHPSRQDKHPGHSEVNPHLKRPAIPREHNSTTITAVKRMKALQYFKLKLVLDLLCPLYCHMLSIASCRRQLVFCFMSRSAHVTCLCFSKVSCSKWLSASPSDFTRDRVPRVTMFDGTFSHTHVDHYTGKSFAMGWSRFRSSVILYATLKLRHVHSRTRRCDVPTHYSKPSPVAKVQDARPDLRKCSPIQVILSRWLGGGERHKESHPTSGQHYPNIPDDITSNLRTLLLAVPFDPFFILRRSHAPSWLSIC